MDCRNLKQDHEVWVPIAAEAVARHDAVAIGRAFHAEHLRLYGYSLEHENAPVEIINVRVQALGSVEKPRHPEEAWCDEDPSTALKGRRDAYVPEDGAFRSVPVYDGHRLRYGQRIVGPAIVEEMTTAIVLTGTWDAIVDRYFPVVDALECELEAIEASMFSNNQAKENIRKLYQLKRKVETLRHAVLPFSEAVGKLFGGRVPDVVKKVGDYFRDVHDHLLIVVGAIDTLRETIGTAIQANLAMVTIEQSEIAKKLAAWAAIFAAMTALAGIWGMNFDLMPELKWRWGYPAALGAMVVVAGVLHYRFRRLGWL